MYIHVSKWQNSATKTVPSSLRADPGIRLTRRQSAGGKIRRLLQSHGLRPPEALLEGCLSGLPGRSQLAKLRLPFRGQGPAPLPPVIADGIDRKTTLSNQCQGSRGRGLINANRLGQLRRGQIGNRVEHLQGRVLGGVQTAVGEQFLIEEGHGSGRLTYRRAITRQRLQFHKFIQVAILNVYACTVKRRQHAMPATLVS